MGVKKGLGRGLGALLDAGMDEPQAENAYRLLPLHKVEPNPDQPRQRFSEEGLQELADSISAHGILQPLTVRETGGGYYQIIAGERRWRAARMAGLTEVPALVVEADDRKAAEMALVENLQRQDLNPAEEAEGYQTLIRDYGLTQEEAARQVGKSRPAVTNALRLLNLCPEVLELVRGGTLSAGHARAIVGLKGESQQRQAAQKAVALGLSVRQTELLCKKLDKPAPKEKAPTLAVDYLAECEKDLTKRLGRKVKIVNGKRKGRFELEFYGQEDLQALLDALMKLK